MKFLIPILIGFSFLFTGCKKDSISSKQSDSFEKFYGGKMNDMGMQVIATDDGGFVIMGNIETASRGKDICFIRTDAFGNSVAPVKLYGSSFDDYGYAMRKTNYGYVIAGSSELYSGAKKDILLVQVDNQGNELKSSVFGTAGNDEAYDIQVLENGNYILTGYSDSTKSGKKAMILAVANADGNLLSLNMAGNPKDDEVGNSIIEYDSANFYTAGYTKSKTAAAKSSYYYIRWISVGSGLFKMIPFFDHADENSPAVSIISDGDSDLIVSCNVQNSQENSSGIKLLKIDKGGNILWQKSFGEHTYDFVSSTYIHNGKIYVIGTSGNADQFGNILLLELGSEGENPQYYYTGDGNSYMGKGLDFTKDNGFIITGSNKTNETSVITFIKLNSAHTL